MEERVLSVTPTIGLNTKEEEMSPTCCCNGKYFLDETDSIVIIDQKCPDCGYYLWIRIEEKK
jgi:hypothetical protein